ncbi:MAG: tetratricopeptide repeat protein [Bacteroidota bacterium]
MSTGVIKIYHIALAAFLLLLPDFYPVVAKAGFTAGSAMLQSAETIEQDADALPSCQPFKEQFEEIDALLKEGRWTDAEVAVIQIGKIAPDCPLVQLFSGKIHYYRRNDRKALALFNDLATRHPELHMTYHFRGLIYHEQGLHTVALEEFHKVMMARPTLGSGYFIRYILPYLESDGRLDPTHIDTLLHFCCYRDNRVFFILELRSMFHS